MIKCGEKKVKWSICLTVKTYLLEDDEDDEEWGSKRMKILGMKIACFCCYYQ